MYVVRLNNVTIKIREQNVFVFNVFGDMGEKEIHVILFYLVEEGFLDPEKEVHVFTKRKSSINSSIKKEDKKKS